METKLEKEITGVIYKFENKINGKIYIGLSRCERARYDRHVKNENARYGIDYAILHDGIENFDYSIIESFTSTNLNEINLWMDEKEVYYISYYDCISPKGYNYLSGGNHPEFSDDLKLRISESITGEKNGFYGKKHSDESKQKMSERAKKRKPNRLGTTNPPEAIEKQKEGMRKWWKWFKTTPEYIEYMKNKTAKTLETRKLHPVNYTEELKKHMSDAHKGLLLVYAKSRKVVYYSDMKYICEFVNPAAAERYFKENDIDINVGAKLIDKGFLKHPEIKLIYADRITSEEELLRLLNIKQKMTHDRIKYHISVYVNNEYIGVFDTIKKVMEETGLPGKQEVHSILNGNIINKYSHIRLINNELK